MALADWLRLFASALCVLISPCWGGESFGQPEVRFAGRPRVVERCVVRLSGERHIDFTLSNRSDLLGLQDQIAAELSAKEAEKGKPKPTAAKAGKQIHRGLRELQRLTQALLTCTAPESERELKMSLLETVAAVNNLARSPVPETVDFFQTPWFFLKRLSRPVGEGRTVASNLLPGDVTDASRLDPQASTFWRRPSSISGQDLFHGFGRTQLLLQSEPLCTYAGPKESSGRNPGFEIESEGTRIKVKFAEVCSEPFASRIFFALGYHADPTDYAARIKLCYSRQILQEFNSRKALKTHFTFLGLIPLFTLELQKHYDPFDYLTRAVLTNGTNWSSAELKRRLFRDATRPHPEEDPANFRPEVESSIAYVETVAANVQCRQGKSIGPWDFGDLDHASRRELRGVGLLAGWLGWFDSRFDNTRLRTVREENQPKLAHFFSDLGGVLGETGGLLYARGERPNAFPWRFTRAPEHPMRSDAAVPFRLAGYKPIAPTAAFEAMTLQDARWMARLIAALSEEQLKQALIASGFDSAQTRLYLEKLVSRRDQMIVDLGLADELPLYRPKGDHHLSYDPATEGPVLVEVAGKSVPARVGRDRVVNGRLLNKRGSL